MSPCRTLLTILVPVALMACAQGHEGLSVEGSGAGGEQVAGSASSSSGASSQGGSTATTGPSSSTTSSGPTGTTGSTNAASSTGVGSSSGTTSGGAPTTCAQARGVAGCCIGNTSYYCLKTTSTSVTVKDCAASGETCGWKTGSDFYTCVAKPGEADPSGQNPIDCE